MSALLLLPGYSGGGFGGGGVSEIARVMAHSAIWTVVAQFIRHSPGLVVAACFIGACGWLLHVHRIKTRQTRRVESGSSCPHCGRVRS